MWHNVQDGERVLDAQRKRPGALFQACKDTRKYSQFSFVFPPKSQVPDMSHRNRPGARGLPIARGNRGGKKTPIIFVINDVFLLFPRT